MENTQIKSFTDFWKDFILRPVTMFDLIKGSGVKYLNRGRVDSIDLTAGLPNLVKVEQTKGLAQFILESVVINFLNGSKIDLSEKTLPSFSEIIPFTVSHNEEPTIPKYPSFNSPTMESPFWALLASDIITHGLWKIGCKIIDASGLRKHTHRDWNILPDTLRNRYDWLRLTIRGCIQVAVFNLIQNMGKDLDDAHVNFVNDCNSYLQKVSTQFNQFLNDYSATFNQTVADGANEQSAFIRREYPSPIDVNSFPLLNLCNGTVLEEWVNPTNSTEILQALVNEQESDLKNYLNGEPLMYQSGSCHHVVVAYPDDVSLFNRVNNGADIDIPYVFYKNSTYLSGLSVGYSEVDSSLSGYPSHFQSAYDGFIKLFPYTVGIVLAIITAAAFYTQIAKTFRNSRENIVLLHKFPMWKIEEKVNEISRHNQSQPQLSTIQSGSSLHKLSEDQIKVNVEEIRKDNQSQLQLSTIQSDSI